MRFYPPSGFPAIHHCILVCFVLIILACLATSQNAELIAYPTRWQLPSRFEHVSSTNGVTSFATATLSVNPSLSDPEANPFPSNRAECYALLDAPTPTVVPVLFKKVGLYRMEFSFETDETSDVVAIRWVCDSLDISYSPASWGPPTEETVMSIELTLSIDGVEQDPYNGTQIIGATPTMIHSYSWSDELNSINVEFTFYCPTAFLENESTTLVIDHPLLDIASITSMHSSPGVNAWDDYVKPYHLFDTSVLPSYSEITCGDHAFQFINGNIGYQFVPSTIPEQPYIHCSFEMQYPPDYIGYAIAQHPIGKIINTHTSDEWEFEMKRQEVIIGSTIITMHPTPPQSVAVWAGPHHNRETFPQFEFGIAQRSYKYYDEQDTLKLQLAPSEILFEVHVHGKGISPFQSLNEWDPRVECKAYDQDEYQFVSNSNIFTIPTHKYDGLGLTCRISLTPPPSILAYSQGSLSIYFFNHDTGHQLNVLQYNPYHAPSSTPVYPLYNINGIDHTKLPAIQPMEWNDISEDGARFIVATCHLQYLLDRPMDLDHKTTLTFVFPDYLSIDDIVSPIVNTHGLVTIASREYTWQTDVVSITHSRGTFQEFLDEDDVDSIDLVFQKGRPIRSPSFQVVLEKIKYEVTQPLSITIKLPINSDADIDELRIFPIFGIAGQPEAYMPQLALITPTLPTPLTGYSYRCVTWDRMIAPYVYDESSPLQVTDDNSSPCTFSVSPQTGKVDVTEASVWRRREFMDDEHMLSGRVCFYELAAVCVTPSILTDGSYVVHPLADCPSFLDETHAVPCTRAFRDNEDEDEDNNDNEEDEPQIMDYSLTNPFVKPIMDPSTQRQTLHIGWWYAGDPRLMLDISVRASDAASTPWIHLDPAPMAYLNPVERVLPSGQSQLFPNVALPLPLFHSASMYIYYRLALKGGIREVRQVGSISNPYFYNPVEGCTSESYKMFDYTTHLCGCIPGYKSNLSTGLNSPYIHPDDFTCTSICGQGFQWNRRSSNCEPMVPVNSVCHVLPDDVEPPFYTAHCGYGVAMDAKCQTCTCFSGWEKKPQNQRLCTHCLLRDKCHLGQTDDITFDAKYCFRGRCLCRDGYYGDQCQYTVMYGTLEYYDVATDEQGADPALVAATKEHPVIVPRWEIEVFEPRVANNVKVSLASTSVIAAVQQATQMLSPDGQHVITTIVVAMRHASTSQPSEQEADPETVHSAYSLFHPTKVSPFHDIYEAWELLQESYRNHPVSNDEEYGALNDVKNAYDPHCVPNGYTYCPGGEDNLLPPGSQVDDDETPDIYEEPKDNTTSSTTLYIIIGVVVGVVVLLFVLLVVSILYCRKHQRACFRQKNKKNRRDTKSGGKSNRNSIELSSKPSSGTSSNVSSQPPSSAASGSTYLPTQTEVADPTLPPDWIGLEDKNTGKVYYSNKVTMESTWDHPARPKDPEENEYGW